MHTQRAQGGWFTWADTPRMTLLDVAALLWAERMLIVMVSGAIVALGLTAALMAPKTYTARTELLVRLGEEYVYQPTAGANAAGAGAAQDMQGVVNAEMRMIGSGPVVRAAIESVGLAKLYPDIAASGGNAERKLALAEVAFDRHLHVETSPATPSIALSFDHSSPRIAADAVNALVQQYLAHRRDVLVGGEYAALHAESGDLDTRAQAANQALADFLTQNQIGDFDAESGALAARAADIDTQLFDADAKRREAQARAGALQAQANALPAEIDLYTESDARRDLVQAQMQREQLLSRYQEDSLPVREVDRRIAQLNSFLENNNPASLVRRGPNPVRQDVMTQLYAMQAEARAQSGREDALTQQRSEVRARLRAMQALEPQFRRLQRQRTILETNAQNFASRAEEARARSQMLGNATDTVSLVDRADAATQGKSLRWPIALASVLIALIVGLTAGLSRGLMRRSFPTPSSAARTLDAPVLAVLPHVHAAKVRAKKAPRPAKGKPALSVVESRA
jgi:uncharacterized protein involved in exopolysaccharide biosynthesis